MALYYIDFNGFTPGPFAEVGWKWGQSNGGYSATINDTGPTAAGKVVNLISSSAGTKVLSPNIVDGINDIEGLVRFRFSSATGKQGILSLRYGGNTESNTTGYTLSGSFIDGKGQLAIDEGGTGYVSWTPWNYQANTTYWARFRVIGNNMKAKVWQHGTAEPDYWMIDTNNSARPTGSYSGMHQYASGTVTYELLSFASDGDTAPAGPTLAIDDASHSHTADKIEAAIPSSTPVVGYSGGYGGMFAGYGSALGLALQNTDLVIANAAHNHTAGGVAVTQVHKAAIANASHGHAADSPIIKQAHGLTIADALHAHLATSVSVTENYNLIARNAAHSLSSDNVSFVTGYAAAAQDALHTLTSGNITLAQAQALVVNNTSHSVTSDNVAVVEARGLAISSSTHGHTTDSLQIIQDHIAVAADNSHGVASTSPAIIQSNLLAVSNSVHAVNSNTVNVIHFTLLGKPDDGVFDVSDTSSDLVQEHTLEAQDASHFFKSDTIIKIINWSELGFDYGYYIPNNPRGGSLEAADGIQQGFIAPNAISRGTFELVDVNDGRYTPDNIETGNF